MKRYKHYSFDLWATLIKSNPIFKKLRAQYFFENFNTNKLPIVEIENIFREVDLMCNAVNEYSGNNIDSEEMYLMVLFKMNKTLDINLLYNIKEIYKDMDALILEYCPVLTGDDIGDVLKSIKESDTSTISVTSNTAFIKGVTLRHILDKLDILSFFDFQIYSDEVNLSKPNPLIFDAMIQQAKGLHQNLDVKEIIHIGDNYKADIIGASNVGLSTFYFNGNNKIINLIQ